MEPLKNCHGECPGDREAFCFRRRGHPVNENVLKQKFNALKNI